MFSWLTPTRIVIQLGLAAIWVILLPDELALPTAMIAGAVLGFLFAIEDARK